MGDCTGNASTLPPAANKVECNNLMSNYNPDENDEIGRGTWPEPELIAAELVPEAPPQTPPGPRV